MTTTLEQTKRDEPLSERYERIKDRAAEAAIRSGRRPEDVIVVAVTKHAEPDQIRELIRLGHIDFGENRVQQLLQRAAMIDEWLGRHQAMPSARIPAGETLFSERPRGGEPAGSMPDRVRWHMIGHLQRNKVRKVLEVSRLIHSVDSLRLAEEIQQFVVKRDVEADVLVQVNVAGEEQKYGCAVPAAMHLAEQLDTMINVRVRGLMAIAPFTEDPEQTRPIFARARELFEEIRDSGLGEGAFNILSMGMSGDFEVAIEEGANIVRVGSSIFGEREPGDEGAEG